MGRAFAENWWYGLDKLFFFSSSFSLLLPRVLCTSIRLLCLEFHDFFYFSFYEVILISYPGLRVSWVNKDWPKLFFQCLFLIDFFQFCLSSFSFLESWPLLFHSISFAKCYPGLINATWIWHADSSKVFYPF
jgi:hypothetical protein